MFLTTETSLSPPKNSVMLGLHGQMRAEFPQGQYYIFVAIKTTVGTGYWLCSKFQDRRATQRNPVSLCPKDQTANRKTSVPNLTFKNKINSNFKEIQVGC